MSDEVYGLRMIVQGCVPRQPPDTIELGGGSECRNFVVDELRKSKRRLSGLAIVDFVYAMRIGFSA